MQAIQQIMQQTMNDLVQELATPLLVGAGPEVKVDKPIEQITYILIEATIDHQPIINDKSTVSFEKSLLILRGKPMMLPSDVNISNHNGVSNTGDRYQPPCRLEKPINRYKTLRAGAVQIEVVTNPQSNHNICGQRYVHNQVGN